MVPLQNRVTPFGEIAALRGRGLFIGNRGILHDENRRILRAWQGKRWIACRLEYRGIRRTIMQPHHWTELFFLDEATAFSAGHRPCAECRREDYNRFRSLWIACYGEPAGADDMDERMHADRLERRAKRTYRDSIVNIPDGTFAAIGDSAWLVWKAHLFAWSDSGYTHRRPRPAELDVDVLTPQSIVSVLRAGYIPRLHPSVNV